VVRPACGREGLTKGVNMTSKSEMSYWMAILVAIFFKATLQIIGAETLINCISILLQIASII
jgi:hypothetical protein